VGWRRGFFSRLGWVWWVVCLAMADTTLKRKYHEGGGSSQIGLEVLLSENGEPRTEN
jgi:hypothetical protein